MLMAHIGAVSLPNDKQTNKQKNTNREKDEEMDYCAITGLKTSESWVSCKKLKKTQIFSALEGGHSSVWGQSLRKPWSWTAFWYGFHPHLEYEGKTEKTIKGIMVVHSEESALEDIVQPCHWSSCMPVEESCRQYIPSQEVSGGFARRAWCVLSSLSESQSMLLCSAQAGDSAIPNLAAPLNHCCSYPALIRPVQQCLKWQLS